MLNSESDCRDYLASQSPAVIAQQLRRDKELCEQSRLPSILVHYLPAPGSALADLIAVELFPETIAFPKSVRSIQYSGLVTIIKSTLQHSTSLPKHGPLPLGIGDFRQMPSERDFKIALKVLDFVLKSDDQRTNLRTPFEEIVDILQDQIRGDYSGGTNGTSKPLGPPKNLQSRKKTCYICSYTLSVPHPQYPSLCIPCGDYNLSSSAISQPESLNLRGKTALVTGGRVNLGFHTALRLLRCGAQVVVSSRYPQDAETRYFAELDSQAWRSRLRIIGADFRAASDVFHLVHVVKSQLQEWSGTRDVKLDILINNAAQTLTDPLEKEHEAVKRENDLRLEFPKVESTSLLAREGYTPRIRGLARSTQTLESLSPLFLESHSVINNINDFYGNDGVHSSKEILNDRESTAKSSWLQNIHEIPYEDVISAHSVNTFVPLILLREFLPVMGLSKDVQSSSKPSSTPSAYIINVTSREGIFEHSPKSSAKREKHVHTNLTKAALNMLTETEAATAWKQRRVAINSVDPGFMSAAPEVERAWKEREGQNWQCPIGWEDGAGRVLWPIAVGETGKGAIWGRFLKHFGSVEIDVGTGR